MPERVRQGEHLALGGAAARSVIEIVSSLLSPRRSWRGSRVSRLLPPAVPQGLGRQSEACHDHRDEDFPEREEVGGEELVAPSVAHADFRTGTDVAPSVAEGHQAR